MVTGIDGDSKSLTPQKLMVLLSQKLGQGNLSERMKLRLLMIATISLELLDKDRKTLSQHLSGDDKTILSKLSWLGVDPTEPTSSKGKGDKKGQNISLAAKNKLKNISTDLLRHTPELEKIAVDIVSGQSMSSQYGNIYIPSTYDGSVKGKIKIGGGTSNVTSLRKGGKPTTTNWSESTDERVQPKYIFFIIGGMSYAEIRVLSDIEKRNPNTTVIIGSTAFIKPDEYIDGISKMASP